MSHLHRRQKSSLADEESIPPRSGPCHFQLTGSSVPSSVSVTGSSGSHCEPAMSINPEPKSSPALRGEICPGLPTHSLLPKQEHSTQAGKAACAEVCRSITAWEGEVESYVNNHKGRNECSDIMDGCWCRRCSCSSGRRSHWPFLLISLQLNSPRMNKPLFVRKHFTGSYKSLASTLLMTLQWECLIPLSSIIVLINIFFFFNLYTKWQLSHLFMCSTWHKENS